MENVCLRSQRAASILLGTLCLIGLLQATVFARAAYEHQEIYSQIEGQTFDPTEHIVLYGSGDVIKSLRNAFQESEIAHATYGDSKGEEEEKEFSSQSSHIPDSTDETVAIPHSSERGSMRQLHTYTYHHHQGMKLEVPAQVLGTSTQQSNDALTLLQFKLGVTGDPQGVLSSWDADQSDLCDDWAGVTCDPISGRVDELNLANYDLQGTLSPKLGDLASLKKLILSNNSFTGVIPAALGEASDLRTIQLDNNNLKGAIPDALGQLLELLTLDLHGNELEGYIPITLGRCSSLTFLSLGQNQLEGTIPDSIGGCLGLRVLRLNDNKLTGEIPKFVNNLEELTTLQVSGNQLSGPIPIFSEKSSNLVFLAASRNQLTGEIPSTIGNCSNLQTILLDDNLLTGSIPYEIELVSSLSQLSVRGNNLTGSIPASVGLLANLTILQLDENQLSGMLPASLGKLPLLQILSLSLNQLNGEIPPNLWGSRSLENLYLQGNSLSGLITFSVADSTSLRELVLSDNHLSGSLPDNVGFLRNLEVLGLGKNKITGMIPPAIGNCSRLQVLDLSVNLLLGPIPPELGFLTNLQSLYLSNNAFTGSIPDTLSNCSALVDLQLNTNHLSGLIPSGFSSLRHLQFISLQDNRFGSVFPDFLQGIGNLTRIDLSGNHLGGPIPVSIGNFTNLQRLNLANNRLTGPIPLELFSLVSLEELVLTNNILDGEIPSEIGQLVRLSKLSISNNNFTGSFPSSIGNCTNLVELNMASNRFSGDLPGSAISKLTRLRVGLNLASNHFSGLMPVELGDLVLLQSMNLSFNSFVYRVPASFANCTALESLDLSHNHLCGEIPSQLALLSNLVYFNISANNMEGPIPVSGVFRSNLTADSFWGNPRLCGYQIGRNCSLETNESKCQGFQCSWFAVTSAVIGVILVGIGVTTWYCLFTKVIEYHRKTLGPEMPHVQQLKVTVHDLTKATDAFSLANIIGVGTRSTVFKGILPGGALIAVKKLEKEKSGTNLWDKKDQYREIDFLGKLRHQNLMKTLSVCWNLDTKALVFDFMENGTLHDQMYGGEPGEENKLTWDVRLRIALGVAQGLVFLHNDCEEKRGEPVIHGDLKPSNIMLDEEFSPKIADVGLARLIMPDAVKEGDEEAMETALTIGTRDYIAPECISPNNRFSIKGDVYSFGVILLELVTGQHPSGNVSAFGEEETLVGWVREANMPEEVIDQKLRVEFEEVGKKNQMLLTLQAGMLCTQDAYQKRPDVKEVLEILNRTKERTFADGDSPV